MSKTNCAENTATKESPDEQTGTNPVETSTDEKRYTLTRFLQVKKQRSGVAALLKLNHGNEIHTVNEWQELVEKVLTTKL
ncbi:MAG: hypothetical protein K2I95_06535 [Treponemataceae bacterium]|nr:hypothetical protein [Treponemataceae bacterium]